MSAREFQVTFDAADPRGLSTFWKDVLDYAFQPPPGVTVPDGADVMAAWDVFLEKVGVPQDQRNSASALIDPAGVGPKIFFQQVPPAEAGKNRLHLDVRAAPGLEGQERMAALEADAERLVALGAERLERFDPNPAKMWAGWIVMADPEGNEFCLD